MMGAVEIALTIVAFAALACLFAAVVWMATWTMEDEDDG